MKEDNNDKTTLLKYNKLKKYIKETSKDELNENFIEILKKFNNFFYSEEKTCQDVYNEMHIFYEEEKFNERYTNLIVDVWKSLDNNNVNKNWEKICKEFEQYNYIIAVIYKILSDELRKKEAFKVMKILNGNYYRILYCYEKFPNEIKEKILREVVEKCEYKPYEEK